ncbi:type II toxin-antitoxin system RelE/ParE family toxin [Alteromonas sp. NFXS44]|uniref:type II toxin-antitoxin system RelE/ParE family toxin n=1 Tax=Alteromonas sp. NFXS44 TaxID=2818435 RepID=UPI0032DFE6FB
MTNYKISNKAEKDIRGIYLYGFQRFGEARADAYYKALFERIEQIATHPYRYPKATDIRQGYRKSVIAIETIYYRIAGKDTVEIMAVLRRQNIRDNLDGQ